MIFVTGGSRSGKSNYALAEAAKLDGEKYFLATCPVVDSEMQERIDKHQNFRKAMNFTTIEEETNIAQQLASLPPGEKIVVVDCLSLWINNLLYQAEKTAQELDEETVRTKCTEITSVVCALEMTRVIFVSNEVGSGIVPENRSSRLYRDLLGTCNQVFAAAADKVVLVVCGIPVVIKQ